MKISTTKLINKIESESIEIYKKLDEIAFINQYKVLNAFKSNKISTRHFNPTNGYGYDDLGRTALCKLYADIFVAEDAIVSPHIMSGTHAISMSLLSILRQNNKVLFITGEPYDTLNSLIKTKDFGGFNELGIKFENMPFSGEFNLKLLDDKIKQYAPKLVYIQRSRGYSWRNALSLSKIREAIAVIKKRSSLTIIFIDNCYGEFVDVCEPIELGADLIAGSLIKNPGGGLAPTGGYIVGKKSLIKDISGRYSVPSIGLEIGSYAASYQPFFQGLFMAPHIVANATKGAYLAARTFEELGYDTLPIKNSMPNDIICSVKFDKKEELIKFCQIVQSSSPIDSFAMPTPWDMPGYDNKVIMAAGTFVQGSSIELSADSPIKEPYIAYMQGGLTYEHIKIAICEIVDSFN